MTNFCTKNLQHQLLQRSLNWLFKR